MKKYKFTIEETKKHARNVYKFISQIRKLLFKRSVVHDVSKLRPPELDLFYRYVPKLAKCIYGSKEYKKYLKELKPALNNHYALNRHHPEYFFNGIRGMNLIDIIEMLCDWKAATLRHEDGDIRKSIELNQKRFGYSAELKQIFLNTINDLGW